jgi:hypothetical protein
MRACSLNLLQVESTSALEICLPQGAAAEVVEIFNLSSSQLIFHDSLISSAWFLPGILKKNIHYSLHAQSFRDFTVASPLHALPDSF